MRVPLWLRLFSSEALVEALDQQLAHRRLFTRNCGIIEMEGIATNGTLASAVDPVPTSDAVASDKAALLPGFTFQTGNSLSQ